MKSGACRANLMAIAFPTGRGPGGPLARYRIEEYVRWEDIDAAGIVNYQAYLRFFGLAESELLRSAGLNYKFLFEVLGIWLPRVRVECNFRRPVKLDELLVVEAYFSRIGRTSVRLEFEVRRKADPTPLVATGRYVLVCVQQGTFAPVSVPQEIRTRLAKYVESPPASVSPETGA
jgi:acyl-CoA thioester hydrolase